MERTVYTICGRPRVAEKVASCTNGKYINYSINNQKHNRK